MLRKSFALLLLAFSTPAVARAQSGASVPNAPQPSDSEAPTLRNVPMNILRDQGTIWTSPVRLNDRNAIGPALLVGATTLLITTDHQVMADHFLDTSVNHDADLASTGLTGMFLAAPVAFFGMGHWKHDAYAEETGVMAGEAIIDSLAVNEAVKIISRRERPMLDGSRGKFFQPGVNFNSSFASNHSTIAWASAAVIASEYNGPMTQILAYTAATGVSLTRVVSRNHFPADVVVGSAVGWMIGRYVQHRHHRAHV